MSNTLLERRFEITPARDCTEKCVWDNPRCSPNSGGFHGIHGSDMRFYLVGDKGAVQFVIFTNWYTEATYKRVEEGFDGKPFMSLSPGQIARSRFGPMPADLGYHKRVAPDYVKPEDSWDYYTPDCEVLNGGCLYDGSGLNAETVFEILVTQGMDAVWTYLEEYYNEVFND